MNYEFRENVMLKPSRDMPLTHFEFEYEYRKKEKMVNV